MDKIEGIIEMTELLQKKYQIYKENVLNNIEFVEEQLE